MEIDKENRDKIILYYNYVKEHKDIEFEVLVRQGQINNYDFMSALQYLRSIKIPFKFNEETLSVNFKHKNVPYRYEIIGKKNINIYCSTNNINNVSKPILISKSWVQGKYPIYINDYSLKINMKEEQPIQSDDHGDNGDIAKEIKKNLYSFKKVFRFKKRFSFFSEDGLFRYDLTIVKSSKREEGSANLMPALNLLSSGIFQSEDQYEIEIEFIRPEKDWPTDEQFIKSLFNQQALLLQVLDEDDHIISISNKNSVLHNYRKLAGIQSKADKHFIGPMPITLEIQNLLKPDLGINSILEDYTVTDKADGERHLLFIDNDGKVYIINNRLNIRFTGLTNETMFNSILDGEYITRSKSNRAIKLFMVFDIYFHKGENVSKLPLIGPEKNADSRILRIENVTSAKFSGNSKVIIQSKEFLSSTNEDSIFKLSKKIIDKSEIGNLPYKIDGLIYTPKYIPVGGLYIDSEPVFGGTWVKVFKWKPPEDNTIDFLVKTEVNESGSDIVEEIDGKYHKILNLYVGYNIMKSQKITPYEYLTGTVDLREGYINTKFEPPEEIYQNISKAYVELDGNNNMRTKSNDIIYDGKVIEITFKNKKWEPLRIRRDKTMGNDFSTAINIWRSINNPVTIQIITGQEELKIDESEATNDDLYYNRLESRDKSASKSMLDFHNYWVKNMNMIAKFNKKATSVYDIACGKGSDRHKYWRAGFKTIVGVDKSEDNIVNPKDGAYSRLLSDIKSGHVKIGNDHRIAYVPIDCSKVIDANYINTIKDEKTRDVIKVLWGLHDDPLLKKYHNLVGNKFDVVGCQFAIHYFLDNSITLNAFITNVASAIKDGGYFIGTCLDGIEVDKNMREQNIKKGESIQGKINDRIIWDIKKSYDKFDLDNPENNYGLKIEVYMETINKRSPEYLVDFRLLENELAKQGIRALTENECKELDVASFSGTFKDLFKLMIDSNWNSYHIDSAKKMKDEEKSYSFMNRWFIFRKDSEKTLEDKKNIIIPTGPIVKEKKPKAAPKKRGPKPKETK
jgi:SAM-dependent methyltransferase